MKTKVIANAIFKASDNYTGVNVTTSPEKNLNLYLKNSIVSLYSAKQFNPDAEVVLILNYDLNEFEQNLFSKFGIKTIKLKEQIFKFPNNFKWGPAFFKLDALNYLSKFYDLICVLDSDTIIVDDCSYMWKESEESLLVYDIDYSLESPKRQLTIRVAKDYFSINKNINHWGGEIVVGTQNNIKIIINECKDIYKQLINSLDKIENGFGQEALLSIAIEKSSIDIERANKYCMRYWTRRYYLVDTNYNNIPIWHLPAEKDSGLLKVYNLLIKKGKLPKKSYLSKKLFLYKKMGYLTTLIYYTKRLIIKLRNGKKIDFNKKKGWIDK